MEQKSLRVNAVWNFVYTGTNILFPLITSPYVSRVLGASNLGKVDFARSFSQWFIVFATFGLTTYGVRAISQVRDNREELNKVFSELFTINLIFSILASLIYLVVIFNSQTLLNNQSIFIVMFFSVVFNVVNIDWFYQGIEEYNYITKRNFFIKVISFVLIMVFVNNPEDYLLYGFFSILGLGLSGILNFIYSRNYANLSIKNLNIKIHLKSLSTFFLITFVISIYTNLDRTLLGIMSSVSAVAFLTRAKSVTTMGGAITNSIASVTMPRASYYLKNDISKYKKLIQDVPKYMMILTIPMVIGVSLLSPEIMFILGGEQFVESSNLLAILSVGIILSSLSTFLQNQVLVPSGHERFGLIASILSSVVNLGTNFFFIPIYGYIGAGIASVLAEFTAVITRLFFIRYLGYYFVRIFDKSTIKYLVASLSMIIPIILIKKVCESYIITFILSAIGGFAIYVIILWFLKEEITVRYTKEISHRLKAIVLRK